MTTGSDNYSGPPLTRRRIMQTALVGAGAALTGRASADVQPVEPAAEALTTIFNARIFDGEWLLDADSAAIQGGHIVAVGRGLARDGIVVDARGGTLLPGLIDAHTHIHGSIDALRQAIRFGVTTELEMNGDWSASDRRSAQANDRIADFRTSLLALTPPGGHPSEMFPPGHSFPLSDIATADGARAHVTAIVARGADYIKLIIEDGRVFAAPGLPRLGPAVIDAAVATAHAHGRMVLAHALTQETAEQAIAAGVDGLAHLFIDRRASDQIVRAIARSHAFVVPTLALGSSIVGGNAAGLARDPRVNGKLSAAARDSISGSIGTYPAGRLGSVMESFAALRDAGVDLLVGTDASVPVPFLHGVVHGASVHHELQLFVRAGCTPVEALRAATSLTARRFDLRDRGRIAVGLRADLLLVDGDPTHAIAATLSIRNVWKGGVAVPGVAVAT